MSSRWQPGQSGNLAGRPPENRALTALLKKAGNKTVEVDGKPVSGKRILARMIWELTVTGKTTFPDGKSLMLDPSDWLGLVKWIYTHIDGPPKGEMDITSGGEPINFIEKVVNVSDSDA